MSTPPNCPTPLDPHRLPARLTWLVWIGLASIAAIVVAVAVHFRPTEQTRPLDVPMQKEVHGNERIDEPPKNEDLWRAARQGQAELVEALLAKGLNADAETEYGVTALQFAAG